MIIFKYKMLFNYKVPGELKKELIIKICKFMEKIPTEVYTDDPRIENEISFREEITAETYECVGNNFFERIDNYIHYAQKES